MGSAHTVTFPRTIDFSTAAEYLEALRDGLSGEILVLDLSATEVIHSSFIGLLIHAKEEIETSGGRLSLITSPVLRKTLSRLNLTDYFSRSVACGSAQTASHALLN
ncbi:MAG TPA: STAS domain-containing protein [Spirochaetota bacterium]|nr:STAS domain-containing protein [Spirochaetota bacterium]